MTPNRDFVSSTFKNTHLYANSATGDDSNSGLSVSKAKKTLTGVFNALPNHIQHNTSVHLDGTFTDSATVKCHIDDEKVLVVDGGDGVTPDPTYGGPHAVTSSDVTWIEVSGASWPVDAMKGMWLQDANDTTKLWLIFKNTSNRIYPCKYFGTPPTSVNVVTPTTTITSSLKLNGCTGRGYIYYQRLNLSSSGSIANWMNAGPIIWATHLYSEKTNSAIYADATSFFVCTGTRMDPTTWVSDSTNTIGVAIPSGRLGLSGVEQVGSISTSVIDLVVLNRSGLGARTHCIGSGSRFGKLILTNCSGNYDYELIGGSNPPEQIYTTAGYQPTEISGSDANGITLLNSFLVIGADIYVQNNASHGIEANGSTLIMTGSVKGSGNGGAGLYAHSGSQVTIKDGSPPTLTGTVGDIAVNDSTYEEAAWSEIDAGESLHSAQEATIIKEVA